MSLDCVPGTNIYIGGVFTLRRREALKKANITHVVSALRPPLDHPFYQEYKHYVVAIDDCEDENILEHFRASNDFIQQGLDEGGSVLVHCAMGKSRSATLVAAYLLHRSHSSHQSPFPPSQQVTPDQNAKITPLDPTSAISLIRQARPMVEPNDSFLAQLHLYHSMGCPTDVDACPAYQRWCWEREVELSRRRGVAPGIQGLKVGDELDEMGKAIEGLDLEDWEDSIGDRGSGESMRVEEGETGDEERGAGKGTTLYKCKRCRTELASSSYLLPFHFRNGIEGWKKEKSLSSSKARKSGADHSRGCSHLWLEQPMSWMREVMEEGNLDGRLECPNTKCKTQVGRYAWQGLKCSCGEWIIPGISLGVGKVDAVMNRGSGGKKSINRNGTVAEYGSINEDG